MNLPGFSADATLYKTKVNYNTTSSHFGTAGSYAVLPQLPIGFCQANCDRIQAPFLRQVCELRCFEQTGVGGGCGGGRVGQIGATGCVPCHPEPDSPGGRYKTCVKRKCDIYDLRG